MSQVKSARRAADELGSRVCCQDDNQIKSRCRHSLQLQSKREREESSLSGTSGPEQVISAAEKAQQTKRRLCSGGGAGEAQRRQAVQTRLKRVRCRISGDAEQGRGDTDGADETVGGTPTTRMRAARGGQGGRSGGTEGPLTGPFPQGPAAACDRDALRL